MRQFSSLVSVRSFSPLFRGSVEVALVQRRSQNSTLGLSEPRRRRQRVLLAALHTATPVFAAQNGLNALGTAAAGSWDSKDAKRVAAALRDKQPPVAPGRHLVAGCILVHLSLT